MPTSSTYRQKAGSSNQPRNSTKSRRLSCSTLPSSCSKKSNTIKPLSTADRCKSAEQPQARPASTTGSFSLSNANEGQCLNTLPIKFSCSNQSRATPLKRRETLPLSFELSFTVVPKFERSNSNSMLSPCDLEGKPRRRNMSQTHKYRKDIGEKRAAAKRKKVDPVNRTSSNNSKISLDDYNQTPKELGQRVLCLLNKQIRSGVVHYLGATHFSEGQWCGIVLDEPFGKNDGCVKGVRYFTCAENYGIFVHAHKVRIFDKQEFATDGLDFKEPEESLVCRNSPRNIKHRNKTMEISVTAESKQVMSNDNIGSCPIKQRSKSFSGGKIIKQSTSDSSKSVSKTDSSCRERSNSTPLTEILDLNKLYKKCKDYREIDTKYKCYDLENVSSIIPSNKMNDNDILVEGCPKEAAQASIQREFMTTSSNLMDDTTKGKDKKFFSSDCITSSASKTKCDSNSPGTHAALEGNKTIDAFVQGKYCSCPNLVPSQHLSSSLAACIDLGRQENVELISSETVSPEDEILSGFNSIVETEHESISDHSEPNYNSNKLPHHVRSKSLPLVLVPVRSISETDSLFWSTDKLQSLSLKKERSVSWPALSTSACRLDLRHDNKIDETYCATTDQQHKIIKATPVLDTEGDTNWDKHKPNKILTLKRQSGVDSIVLSDISLSHSDQTELSLPSVKATRSMKGQKDSASSTSSTKSQTRPKSHRNSKAMSKSDTVNSFKKCQTANLTYIAKPPATKRSTNALSSASTTIPQTCGKSKLPTMKKVPLFTTEKPHQSKLSIKKAAIRPSSIALQDVKKLKTNQTKEVKSLAKTSAKRKPPMLESCRTSAKPGGFVKKRLQTARKPEQQALPAADKDSTNTTLLNKGKSTKSISPQSTAGRPTSKHASSPSKPYHSRLPTRKITSRDESVESTHSQERDIDTASVGTEESDYIDNRRFSPVDDSNSNNYDADCSNIESNNKSWQYVSHAPDLLTGTREINRRSVEVQVEVDEEIEENMRVKYFALERLLHEMKNDCHDLKLAVDKRDTHLFSSAILIAALCRKLQGNGRLIMHLKQDLYMTELDLKQLQERLAEEEANTVKLQEEMMYVRSEHTVAIQNLKADYENTLEGLRYSLNKQYAEEISKVNDEHAKELAEINKAHDEKLLEVKKRQEKTLADVTEKYNDEVVELESRHSQQIDEVLEEHQVEIETIKTDYEKQHAALESKLLTVTEECASLNKHVKQFKEDIERDIKSKVQVEIENYKALPAEVESMKAVLDMRNEENKQLKKERMEAQMELDHLRKVADRVKKLEHENESLSFVVENKSKFERQLSVEHEHLKNALDRESKKLKRLSLENEELQWKLYQSSPTEENSAFEFPVNGSPPTSKRRNFRLSTTSPDVNTIDE